MAEHPEAGQAETSLRLPQKEEEGNQRASDASAEAASTAGGKGGSGTIHSAVMANESEAESQEGKGQDAEADDSSMEYAGDLNVSDDEATLEAEEVNTYSFGSVQIFSSEMFCSIGQVRDW